MAGDAPSIEDALKRVLALGERDAHGHASPLAGSRRAILDALRSASEPLTIEEISVAVELHTNTTRHHLDVLSAAGLVDRAHTEPSGRGRPRTRYQAAEAAAEAYTQLEEQLEAALHGADVDEVARETARRWLATVPPVRHARDLDEAVAEAVISLREVGFAAHSDEVGDTIVVTDCPYAGLIAEHPMICTVHAELVSRALHQTGQPVELDGFDVWVRPGICRARLRRPDTEPDFVALPATRITSTERTS